MKRLVHKFRPRNIRRISLWAIVPAVLLGVCNWVVFPLPTDKLHRSSATFVYSREGHLLNCFTSPDSYWRKPVTIDQISPLMVQSVIACEDRWFYWHPGFNPVALAAAAIDNIRAGKPVRGGSTITMQIARMMEPKPRTIPNKIIEIWRAAQLELRFSKRELLEIYFNLAPYGGNIEGIGAAAHFYFDKTPDKLSASEVAILTAIPSSPSVFRPDRDPAKCLARRNQVLGILRARGVIPQVVFDQAMREEIPIRRVAPAVAAPHFCQSVAAASRHSAEIRSTIDFNLQRTCEQLASGYQQVLSEQGIWNLSIVVLDNRTGELLAMVGSADYADVAHHGQINGALARRSPGSALKPFAYALGFERGIISPARRVEDLPINYAGYIPTNYDEQYHGVVPVREALVQSLNVPAVNLTAKVGLQEVYELLCRGGITTLDRKYYAYGLPLILGSCEVTLLELSNLYATLARAGSYLPVHSMKVDEISPVRLLSPEACYLVTEILADLKRPDLPSSWEFTAGMPRVSWKTGTSYGRKDAWAVGYNPTYTVGVWAGNFSAEGSVAIVGAEAAAPLMFEIFGHLCPDGESAWFTAPRDIATRTVCAVSGHVAGEACPETISEPYIEGVSPADPCPVHKKILVDAKSGYQVCPHCVAGKQVREQIIETWPPRQAAWLTQKGIINLMPPHNPECRGELAGAAPVITSPEEDAVYVIRPSAPPAFQNILFECSAGLDCHNVYWFLDGRLYSEAPSDERVFYAPEKGRHRLMCVDTYGRSTAVSFQVQ